ncbi:Exocyst complex component SEC10b [Chlorella vulgaris]
MTADKKREERSEIGVITLQDVTESSTADLVAKVAGPGLLAKAAASNGQSGNSIKPSLVQLLERFERRVSTRTPPAAAAAKFMLGWCDKEMARLQHQVDLKAERVRREAAAEQGAYRGQVAALEAQWGAAQAAFADLEGRMTQVTQAAAKIGNRLQNAEVYRRRALDAGDAIRRLQEFAHATDPSALPPLFHDDARLGQAAAMTGKLLAVSQELISSRERVGLAGPRPRPNVAPTVGTIENALEQLELYRNLLDNRVVSRFDAALARQDLPAMADCARTMAQFSQGESMLVHRYISTRPMFTSLRELQFVQQQQQLQASAAAAAAAALGSSGNAAAQQAAAAAQAGELSAADLSSLRALSSFYKGLLSAMRDEAVVLEQVFSSPAAALAQYLQRVFEQKVQTAVDAVLAPPQAPAAGAAGALRCRLRLMAEVYGRTRALADDLQELCGAGDSDAVRQLADGVCGAALEPHLHLELAWLAAAHEARLASHAAAGGGLSMEEVLAMLGMNEEAVSRCVLLSPPAQLAPAVRCLFLSSTPQQAAATGCLLEQVAAHALRGLATAVEAAARAAAGPFNPRLLLSQQGQEAAPAAAAAAAPVAAGGLGSGTAPMPAAAPQQPAGQGRSQGGGGAEGQAAAAGPLSRQDLHRAAAAAVGASLGAVLQAVSTLGAMVSLLQQHYLRLLAPHLAGSAAEERACVAGLGALARGAEERVAGALQRCLALLLSQADSTLQAQQQRTDFCPPEAGAPPPPLDTPTPACLALCALLGAAVDAAERHLHGPNLTAFLAELGRRCCLQLEAHQQRQCFSPLGALRWKRDLSEYGCTAARLRSPAARLRLEELGQAANMLVVGPDSLLPLVDTTLRISHTAALAVIQLRQDYRTARVGEAGASLAALFSNE